MKRRILGIAALAAILVVSAAALAAKPEALPEQAKDHPSTKALGAERPDAAAHAQESDDVDDAAPADDDADTADHERGHGLLNAIEHVPDHVRAHLQSLWDAMQDGLQGLGEALVKPTKPNA